MEDSIRLEASAEAHARSLGQALTAFNPNLVELDASWHVEINPDLGVSAQLVELFETLSVWLERQELVSCQVHFGERALTIFRPLDKRPHDSSKLLLERIRQLQTALESRIVIEQAKGILAGRLRLDVEDAFDVLRRAARDARTSLQGLALDVVRSEEIPPQILEALASPGEGPARRG